MKADCNSRESGARLPCREHPVLCLSLFAFMFVPAVAGEVALGRWLTQFMPHPGVVAMLCFAPVMVSLFIIGMLIGATIWLLLMKRFVHQNILATFFLGGPRVPVFSSLCSKIFAWSYGQNRPKTEL
jgi:fucose permease